MKAPEKMILTDFAKSSNFYMYLHIWWRHRDSHVTAIAVSGNSDTYYNVGFHLQIFCDLGFNGINSNNRAN